MLHSTSAEPTNHRLRSVVSIWSLNASPTIPIGTEPSTTAQPKRQSGSARQPGRNAPRTSAKTIRRKSSRK